jgi:hypothetical protein
VHIDCCHTHKLSTTIEYDLWNPASMLQVHRSGRTSLVVFCLALVMGLGLGCITAFGVPSIIEDIREGRAGMDSLCD